MTIVNGIFYMKCLHFITKFYRKVQQCQHQQQTLENDSLKKYYYMECIFKLNAKLQLHGLHEEKTKKKFTGMCFLERFSSGKLNQQQTGL